MSDDNLFESLVDDESRRSFMKKGAAATTAAAIGGAGVVSAHQGQNEGENGGEGGDGGVLDEGWKALTFVNNFHPRATFAFVSGVTEWVPNYGPVQAGWFSEYNTRLVRWQNTGEVTPLFVAEDAQIGSFNEDLGFVTDANDDDNQPQLFEVNKEWTPFSEDPRLVTMNVSPVGEEEEDRILQDDDWWLGEEAAGGADGGGGNQTATGNETATGNQTATQSGNHSA